MSRLPSTPTSTAKGITAEIFTEIKKSAGIVPNVYAAFASHCPNGLKATIDLDKAISESNLTEAEITAIRLQVSVELNCEYCINAYAFLGQFSDLSKSVIADIIHKRPTKYAQMDAILNFSRTLINSKGVIDIEHIHKVMSAGYTEKNLIEICLIVSNTILITLINRVNDTAVDFPSYRAEDGCAG